MLGTLSTVTEHTEDRSAEDPTRQGLLGGVTLYIIALRNPWTTENWSRISSNCNHGIPFGVHAELGNCGRSRQSL